MSYFLIGFIALSIATVIFWIVWFSIMYYWHNKKETFVIVPALFTFEFFLAGFLLLALIAIAFQYLPDVTKLIAR